MSIFDPLKNYCERSGEDLFSEPLNAISNIAFFIAAWLLWQTYKKIYQTPQQVRGDKQAATLIALLTLVGIGSTLFHTFANKLTMIFDIVPIALFTFYYLWVAMRRLIGLTKLKAACGLILFVIVAVQMGNIPDEFRFNNSADYFPCLAALLIIGVILKKRQHATAPWLLKAAFCFALSLTFRSIDFMVCPYMPIGTHFIWHSLNGLMLYLLVRAIITPRNAS